MASGTPRELLRDSLGIPRGLLRDSLGIPRGLPRDSIGILRGLNGDSLGIPCGVDMSDQELSKTSPVSILKTFKSLEILEGLP